MGRRPCCEKKGLNRGGWTAKEDEILSNYIKTYGKGKWSDLPQRAGLKRCGKSCRIRWLNYLIPGVKRGNISADEEDLIVRLHKLLGNRWSLIAGRIPGRTDNEIKNYWNTNLSKRSSLEQRHGDDQNDHHKPRINPKNHHNEKGLTSSDHSHQAKATRPKPLTCTKVDVGIPSRLQDAQDQIMVDTTNNIIRLAKQYGIPASPYEGMGSSYGGELLEG